MEPRRLGIADARQRLLKIVDALPAEGVLLTKRGKVVAKFTPMRPATLEMFGALKGKSGSFGDVVDTSLPRECRFCDPVLSAPESRQD